MKRKLPEETKEKIRQSLLGKKHTLKRKLNISRGRKGIPNKFKGKKWPEMCGEKHPNWKGGKIFDKSNGYFYVNTPNRSCCGKTKRVLEQRFVAEKHLGRYLLNTELVHHINFIPTDNRPINLFVFENMGQHISYHLLLKNNPFLKTWLRSNLL